MVTVTRPDRDEHVNQAPDIGYRGRARRRKKKNRGRGSRKKRKNRGIVETAPESAAARASAATATEAIARESVILTARCPSQCL
jgi:hypothetical protein